MPPLENIFSWSKSRDEQFRECQRKYYYDKYASWGGWDRKAPEATRLAYVLKNLKNRWAWKGEVVHHLIEEILKTIRAGGTVSLEEAQSKLIETMRRDYRSSKAKKYYEDPKRNVGLFEHEYQKPISDEQWKEIHAECAGYLKNFYTSDFFKELLADDPKNWLLIEDLEDYQYDDAKIYVKLDFARRKEGVIEIYDWKTGKNDEAAASVQIGAYALYAMQKWNIGWDKIRAYLFNLSTSPSRPQLQVITEALLEETRRTMSESIRQMQKHLLDIPKNIPLPKENFAFTENERLCNYCNFYKICDKFAKVNKSTVASS